MILLNKKYILEKNFSNKKNLLLLIGNLRTIEYLFEYHKKLLDDTGSDLAISTWHDERDDVDLLEKIQKYLKPVFFEIQDFNFNLTIKYFGKLNKFDLVFGKSALSTRAQVYKFIKIIDIVNEIENLQKKKYEILIKSRPDLFISSQINLKINDNELLFESTMGDWTRDRSDRFFYAKKEYFFKFIESLINHARVSWDDEAIYPVYHMLPLQEQFLKYCCDKSNFKTKLIFPTAKIWRPKKNPNIFDRFFIFFKKSIKILFYIIKK